MRRYLSLLLFIGLAFGQVDSTLDIIILKNGESFKGEIVSVEKRSVSLQVADSEDILTFKRTQIKKISTPENRNSENTQASKNASPTIIKKGHGTSYYIGALLISGSGLYGFLNKNSKCDDCRTIDDIQDWINRLDKQTDIQLGMLFLGGLLMALD